MLGTNGPVGHFQHGLFFFGVGMIVETYVGVGNFLTIVGNTAYTQELGTRSSARAGVN